MSVPRSSNAVVNALVLAGFLLVATRQNLTVPYTGLGLSPAQLILFVLAGLWVVTRIIGQRAPAGFGLLSGLVVLLAAAALVSYGLSQSRFVSGDIRQQSDRSLLLLGIASLTIVVIGATLRSRRDIEFVLRALVAGGAVSGLFAVARYATGVDVAAHVHLPGLRDNGMSGALELIREGVPRPQGAASAPLELGGVMTVLVPIGLSLFFAARRRGERAWPWGLAVALMASAGAVSLSRSVFLGLAAALLVMVPRWPVRRTLLALVGGLVVVAAGLASGTGLVNAISSLLTQGSGDYSLGSRSDGRAYVYAHFAEHFWLGQGIGTYDLSTQKVLDNQYLSQLMETGVTGLLLLIALLVTALLYALRARSLALRLGAASDVAELANGVAGAMAGVIVVSAVLDTSGFIQIFTLIWLLIALCGAVWRLAADDVASDAASAAQSRRPVAVPAR